jgi:hypothetical protein
MEGSPSQLKVSRSIALSHIGFAKLMLLALISVLPVESMIGWQEQILEAAPKKKKKKKKKKTEEVPAEEASTDGSAKTEAEPAVSDYKKVKLLANVGLLPNSLFGFGATAGFNFSHDFGIEGLFSTASKQIDPVVVSVTSFGFRAHKNFGSIPYVAGGMSMRMLDGSWNTVNKTKRAEYESSYKSTALTLDLAAGAEFKLGAIVIGADLVGIMFPVTKLSSTEGVPEKSDYDTGDYDEQKAKVTAYDGMNLMLVRLGIGIAF